MKKTNNKMRKKIKNLLSENQKTNKKSGGRGKSKKPLDRFFNQLAIAILIFVVFLGIFSSLEEKKNIDEISLSALSIFVLENKVEKIEVERDGNLEIFLKNGEQKKSKKEAETSLTESLLNFGLNQDNLKNVEIEIKKPSGIGYVFEKVAPFIFPILLLIILFYFLTRGSKGGGGAMQAFTFGNSRAKFIDPKDAKNRVTFKNVAGAKEAKEELEEVVDFLKNPKKFLKIGATIPKGVLMMGLPGTGKTLLARAVAGEAGVPFFSVSGSEFVEMFVGVGASRVRDLFNLAKKSSPSIIFIDEIDAIGRVRGGGTGGGNDEREQTLNQILVEMDGFENDQKVIVMAATNRPEVLDPALLRPGRFDRRVTIDLPDKEDRLKILEVHSVGKPFFGDVDLDVIASRTPSFSGADLQSLMNEGAILAARENRDKISQYDLIRSIEKVILGPERKSHILSDKDLIRTVYHEVGHALVGSVLEHADPVHKISIISRGRAAGYTLNLPFEDKSMNTKEDFLADISVALAGYAAELKIFGDVTTGPSNDLQVSTGTARAMVTKYGMSEKVGVLALDEQGGGMVPGSGSGIEKAYSEKTGAVVDEEVARIMEECMEITKAVLDEHEEALHDISEKLIEIENMEREDFEKLLEKHGIKVKKEKDKETKFLKIDKRFGKIKDKVVAKKEEKKKNKISKKTKKRK